ncbi:MAG: alpha/beta hydrolase [Eubacteriales bacterium]|nr:alpha/beta hydrolase [Eubacteriales bacterium]
MEVRKEEFTFLSSDGVTTIHAKRWVPEGEIKAVLQIAHGMAEYIDRYDAFARYLAADGFVVTGNDHLGHGKSITDETKLGFFAKDEGNKKVLSDLHHLYEMTKEMYPDVPYFFMGHSMGSFLCRQYISEYGNELSGAIIMGTGNQSAFLTAMGKAVCKMVALFKGWDKRSGLVDAMAFGSYNKLYGEPGGYEWLSENAENVKKYNDDPLCGFGFTLNGYYNMFHSINLLSKDSYIGRMPKELPVFIVAGEDDPVGDYGKAPKEVYNKFKELGMKDVEKKLYYGDRHEILNEDDRETVYEDIREWLDRHTA